MTWITTTSIPTLIERVLGSLAVNAVMSLQGDLREYDFPPEFSASLHSHIMKPVHDTQPYEFILLTLEQHTVHNIVTILTNDAQLCSHVAHLRVEKEGKVVFNAGDHFHAECISMDEHACPDLIRDMQEEGLITILS